RSGLIIHISSDAATQAYAGWGAYGVSKAALDHLGRIWAEELAWANVRFLMVDPGEMDTQMHAEAMPDADRTKLVAPGDVALNLVNLITRSLPPSGARIQVQT